MRRLPDRDIERIQDFSAEAAISLPSYALEKDYHVLEAMRLIVQVPPNSNFRLVFCGGTCLSKAYGALERMSEDVDFKVVPTTAGAALSRTKRREFAPQLRGDSRSCVPATSNMHDRYS